MCLRPQPIWFTNHPAILRLCVSYDLAGMPLFSSLFGSSSAATPAAKRRASPLRESSVRKTDEEDDESSDYVMEEIKDEQSARSNLPEEDDLNMEQADYERDSDLV